MASIVRCISHNGGAVASALDATDIVERMRAIHATTPVCTAALGRLVTAAALMGGNLKSPTDTLTLRVKGDGPARSLIAVANGRGEVKACMGDPAVQLPLRADGKLDVGGAVGHTGTLTVIRDLGLKEPYVGQVPLASGEIAEDITAYYAASEQIPTVCALGVLVDVDGRVKRAGGYLLQLLPGAGDDEITLLEHNVAALRPVTALLEAGSSAQDIAQCVLEGFAPETLDTQPACYRCDCSRARMESALLALGRRELEALGREQQTVEVGCQFCGSHYRFAPAKLLARLQQAAAPAEKS